ncbi:hypothetical protein Droror1_Dr00000099 [Drosera rotundifolia]
MNSTLELRKFPAAKFTHTQLECSNPASLRTQDTNSFFNSAIPTHHNTNNTSTTTHNATKLLDRLAKLKFLFLNGFDDEIGDWRVTVETNWASVEYDVKENDARVWGAVGVGKNVTIITEHHFRVWSIDSVMPGVL